MLPFECHCLDCENIIKLKKAYALKVGESKQWMK